jgi:hypothetical protein
MKVYLSWNSLCKKTLVSLRSEELAQRDRFRSITNQYKKAWCLRIWLRKMSFDGIKAVRDHQIGIVAFGAKA